MLTITAPLRRGLAAAVVVAAVLAATAPASEASVVRPRPVAAPAFDGDAPDPDVFQHDGVWYAFTTGTRLGNHIQVLVNTTGTPASGWRSYTGQPWGSSALPRTPAWQRRDTSGAPSVVFYGGRWLMFYDAMRDSTGHFCLSVAVADALTPSSPVFTDNSTVPLHCRDDIGGLLDPDATVDPATGRLHLVFKSNDGTGSRDPSRVFSVEMDASGTRFATQPRVILTNERGAPAWHTTYDNPQFVLVDGQWFLLFSPGDWERDTYAEALAACDTPAGPCTPPDAPFLTSHQGASGPGGGTLFTGPDGEIWVGYHAWRPGCTNYGCGGERRLFVASTGLGRLDDFVANLYRDVLGRPVDPGGQRYWVRQLVVAYPHAGVLAAQLAATDEYRGSVVDAIYRTLLGRAPDPGGRSFWVGQLRAGLAPASLRIGILASDEYFHARSGGDAANYVTNVYRALLGRDPDRGGLDYWTSQLRAGVPRARVAGGLVGSDEALRLVVRGSTSACWDAGRTRGARRTGPLGWRPAFPNWPSSVSSPAPTSTWPARRPDLDCLTAATSGGERGRCRWRRTPTKRRSPGSSSTVRRRR